VREWTDYGKGRLDYGESKMESTQLYDAAVIGGGVVGIAVARSAVLAGLRVALLEASPDLLTGASGSNSGIACTGVDAAEGTLERALIRDAISQIRSFCRDHNVPNRPCGSLVCLWPWDVDDDESSKSPQNKLEEVARESWDAGDTHAAILSSKEVEGLEPNLSRQCQGAVHIKGEVVLDPFLFPMALLIQARENGLAVFTNFRYSAFESSFDEKEKVWTVRKEKTRDGTAPPSPTKSEIPVPDHVRARVVINATGIDCDITQNDTGDAPPATWTARPRRGQYRIFNMTDKTRFDRPIQPVPNQFSKGIFVFSTIYNQIVVGPTALDQESRIDRDPDEDVAAQLSTLGTRILPGLDPKTDFVGEYVGIRPGTDKRDYQIHAYPERHWISAAGIRSTGLTASLGIGRYVKSLLQMMIEFPHEDVHADVIVAPLPPFESIIADFKERGDGYVTLNGYEYRVTHPLTALGWQNSL
jgi:glycerol-3-phosphate dehydrogenase